MFIKALYYNTDTGIRYNVQRYKRMSEYTCKLYIKNCSYSNKVGIVFAMYQKIRSKGKSWAVPCPFKKSYINENNDLTVIETSLEENIQDSKMNEG